MFHCPEPLEGNLWLYINLVSKVAAVLDKGCCFRSVLNINLSFRNVVECWTFFGNVAETGNEGCDGNCFTGHQNCQW